MEVENIPVMDDPASQYNSSEGRPWFSTIVQKATWFSDITEKEKSEAQIVAECSTSTTVKIATALGFFSRTCSLQSLEMLESEH